MKRVLDRKRMKWKEGGIKLIEDVDKKDIYTYRE